MPPLRSPGSAYITGIGTAAPTRITQQRVAELAERTSSYEEAHLPWVRRIYSRAGVQTRGTVLEKSSSNPDPTHTIEHFYPPAQSPDDLGPSTAQRMQRYAAQAPALAHQAAHHALAQAYLLPREITHLITVSCTGFSAPGLDAALIEQLSLPRDVRRLHVGFMGCHAVFNALEAARAIVLGQPDAIVLLCSVELCSLHYAYGAAPDRIVANALFADGAAAAIARAESNVKQPAWRIIGSASRLVPGSRDAMTWRIGDHGFEMSLSPSVPDIVGSQVRPWCESWLADLGRDLHEVQSWAVHPGGPKVLSAVEQALALTSDDLRFSRDILARYGNVSSATILFILQEMSAARAPGLCIALGFGPGLMMEGFALEPHNPDATP